MGSGSPPMRSIDMANASLPDPALKFDRLLKFLPLLGEGSEPGEWGGGSQPDGSIHWPQFAPEEALTRFVDVCYEDGWILTDFDWMAWESQADELVRDPAWLGGA